MGWAALDNKHQVYENQPKKAFQKAKAIYGKRMQHAPRNPVNSKDITTDFKALLALRNKNSRRKERSNARFQFFTGILLSFFLIVLIINIL